MEELYTIFSKYNALPLKAFTTTYKELDDYLVSLSKDLCELSDMLCRIRDEELFPNYYSLNDCTIVGSMVRMVKLYKEMIRYYEEKKMEIYSLFARPLYESFIMMKYLVANGAAAQQSFRLISYQSRYKNYQKLKESSTPDHPLIQRQLIKLAEKLRLDELTIEDLDNENSKKNNTRWKLDGKSFWQIHSEVDNEHIYSFMYGVSSDSIHGNWQEIFDFHLTRKENGYFGFLNYETADCRMLVPMNRIMIESLECFLSWNGCLTGKIESGLSDILECNSSVYLAYETKFGEPID